MLPGQPYHNLPYPPFLGIPRPSLSNQGMPGGLSFFVCFDYRVSPWRRSSVMAGAVLLILCVVRRRRGW